MAQPAVTATAQAVYDRLAPAAADDEAQGWPLLNLCSALAGMLDELDIARTGEGGEPGWSSALDPDLAPAKWLPWLAQLGGVRLLPGLPDDEARTRIKSADGWRRGTPSSMIAAAQRHLTGARRVTFRERDGGAYRVTVITYTAETPDSALVLAALREQKPAGLALIYTVLDGWDYTEMAGSYASYNALAAAFANYDDLDANDP